MLFRSVNLSNRDVGSTVASIIEEKTGLETRSAVTGHIQRGGAPTAFDRVLASRLGVRAAQCVHEKDFGKMVALKGTDIVTAPIDVAVGTLKVIPTALYEGLTTLFNK